MIVDNLRQSTKTVAISNVWNVASGVYKYTSFYLPHRKKTILKVDKQNMKGIPAQGVRAISIPISRVQYN